MTFDGLWEDTLGVNARKLYTFNGAVVAHRDGAGVVTYLHGDHLGSVSVVTSAGGTQARTQEFGPWGQVRSGGVSSTSLNFTGQRRDDTGLLFYNARYYNPALGRFISADTIVPGSDALTTTPGDATAQEAWGKGGGGPASAQELNRYSYVNNNPVKNTDPTGHCIPGVGDCVPIWEIPGAGLNLHDSAEVFTGFGEGALSVVEGIVQTPAAVVAFVQDPAKSTAEFVEGIQQQATLASKGAEFLVKDPGGAAQSLNDDPRTVGKRLMTT